MVLDTSALLAILFDEPERHAFNVQIAADPVRLMSAATYLETAIAIESRWRYEGTRDLKAFIAEAGIEIVSVTAEHAEIARDAYRRFGKGLHAAGLNFGDCFAYALAKSADEPLLFKGNAFSLTDIRPAA